ncbi:MAG: helix-turn-helix domain-containing protein [Nanoarchaeota archaeon]|nr:helix-turn-helix domain-containing protein [Nanoarchaeota archaeon]
MEFEILENIGFTKGEIKVYFALLKLGNTSSGAIINRSGVSRSKVYEILDKLKEKGLVTEVIRKNIRYFQAASPERIKEYMDRKKDQLIKLENDFEGILPSLTEMQKYQEDKQQVKVYVGLEGLKTLYSEILATMKKNDDYLAMTFAHDSMGSQSILRFFHNFHQKRALIGCNAKVLVNYKDNKFKDTLDFSDTRHYEFRTTVYRLPTGIAIYKDIVATIILGEVPKIFVIISKENADHYRKFFYDVWEKSENKKR